MGAGSEVADAGSDVAEVDELGALRRPLSYAIGSWIQLHASVCVCTIYFGRVL